MSALDTDLLPAMPVANPEMHDMCEALDSADLSPQLRVRLRGLIIAFCSFDRDDTAGDGMAAIHWKLVRQDWREFVAAWRTEYPLPHADAS